MQQKNVLAGLIFIVFLFSTFLSACRADAFDSQIRLGLAHEYHDNLFFDERHGTESQVTVLSSFIELKKDTDVLKTRLSGELNHSMYTKDHGLDNEDWAVHHDLTWFLSERTSLSLSIGYDENANLDRYLSLTGALLDTREQDILNGKLALRHRFSEQLTVESTIACADESFSSPLNGESDYSLFSQSMSGGLTFQWDETTSFNGYLGYGLYDYDTHTVDLCYASLGVTRSFSETLTGFVSAGARHTTYSYDVLAGIDALSDPPVLIVNERHDQTWGWIGKAGLEYQGDGGSIGLTVDESLQPSAGQNQSLSRTTVDLSCRKELTDDLSGRITSQYYYNRNDDQEGGASIRFETYRLWSGLFYALTDDLSLSGQYTHSEYKEKSQNKNRNIYRISMEYTF